jgi:TonB-dependent SusC/RagA subfamily outer membrane receptor
MKKVAFIAILILLNNNLFSQTVIVKGKVTCFQKYALKNIVVEGSKSKSKVLTNEFGVFEIVCYPQETLIFRSKSFYGMKRKISDPKDSIIVNLVFKETKKSKEYAIANGLLSEEILTYAIPNLTNENNSFSGYANVYDLIVGRFAGVEVSGKCIIIRGERSINFSNCALLIVDGIDVQDLSHISPSQVKSIDVLKGTEASIYGVRGANGVICITLKK